MVFAIIEAKYPANGSYPPLAAERVYVDRLAMEQFKWAGPLAIGIAVLASRRLGIEPVSNLAQKRINIF